MSDPQVNSFDLTPVTTSHVVAGGTNRNPAWVTVKPSGYTYTDLEGTLLFGRLLSKLGVTRENLKLCYGANPVTGMVGIYVDQKGEHPGAMQVRDTGNVIRLHLGGVFKEHSHLRPSATVECGLSLGQDGQGNLCLVFNILKGSAKVSRRKPKSGAKKTTPPPDDKTTDPEAQKQPAAGQQGQAQPAPEAEAED